MVSAGRSTRACDAQVAVAFGVEPASQTPRVPRSRSRRAPVLPRAAMRAGNTGPREGSHMTGESRPDR